MTKFIVGLLLGLILGIGGTAAFLISAGGGDYLVVTSPRVRELETSLKQADQEREWLRGQLRGSNEILVKLESRFVGLASRFEDLGSHANTILGAPPAKEEADPATTAEADVASLPSPSDVPTASPRPTATQMDTGTPTPVARKSPRVEAGGSDEDTASPD